MIAAALVGAALHLSAPGFAQSDVDDFASQSSTIYEKRLSRETYGLGPWRLTLERDGFSEAKRCTLTARGGRLFYHPGAVGFALGKSDLGDAMVRVDAGVAISFRDLLPELAAARVRISGRDMDRPTDGLVWVPISRLGNAGTVAIAPRFGGRVRRFTVAGFERLVAYARAQGCEPEGAQP